MSTIENAVALLLNKRIDAFVDFDYNIPKEYKSKLNYVELVPARPIYLAFSNDHRRSPSVPTFGFNVSR